MTADVIPPPSAQPLRTPIGHAIRTGEWSYKQIENLHAEGRLPASTVIVDASKARLQTRDESINKRLAEGGKRIGSLARTFETLVADIQDRAPPPVLRGANIPGNASMRTL